MSPELIGFLIAILSQGFVLLGAMITFMFLFWRMFAREMDRLNNKIDGLSQDHNGLSRELSELRGEIRGRFGEQQPAE